MGQYWVAKQRPQFHQLVLNRFDIAIRKGQWELQSRLGLAQIFGG